MYTKINATTAEKTTEVKQTITLDQANARLEMAQQRLAMVQAEVDKAQKEVDDLKALGLKTQAKAK